MTTKRRILQPLNLARTIVAHRRSPANDAILATILAGIAGAANAGGFFAVGQYTSHMTGYLSLLGDDIAIARWQGVFVGVLAVSAFTTGAAFSTVLINQARRHGGQLQYAWPLAVQGAFMVCFSGGGIFSSEAGRLFSIACLCFIMGMQNATITKISRARVRTTHATGMVTDIGIEIGRAVSGFLQPGSGITHDRQKLRTLVQLVLAFLLGGIVGAIGYSQAGFLFSLPLACILLALSLPMLMRHPGGKTILKG